MFVSSLAEAIGVDKVEYFVKLRNKKFQKLDEKHMHADAKNVLPISTFFFPPDPTSVKGRIYNSKSEPILQTLLVCTS